MRNTSFTERNYSREWSY